MALINEIVGNSLFNFHRKQIHEIYDILYHYHYGEFFILFVIAEK